MVDTIDPVAGLVAYVEEIKPYHTKIIEVLVEYIHTDCIDVTITEDFELAIGVPSNPLAWGWSEEEANRMFNDNWTNYQISGASSSGGYWDIAGDFDGHFETGDTVLVKDDNSFTEYTVSSSAVISQTVNGVLVKTTRVFVNETIPVSVDTVIGSPGEQVPIAGAIFHREAFSYDPNTGIYTLKAGLVLPSPTHVEKYADCGGFGSQFEHTLAAAALVPNAILSSNSSLNYFEINNTLTTPIVGANTWADVLRYGTKIQINGTANDKEYTVFLSAPSGGSPDILRVYVLEAVAFSEGVGGTLTAREWGYDEPDVCTNQGQSLAAQTNISERLEFVVNDVGYNLVNGWDMAHWDLGGFDGGPVTIVAALT